MSTFNEKVRNYLTEFNTSGAGGVFGHTGDTVGVPGGPGDIYAPGDARIPKLLGAKSRKKKKKKNGKS